MAEIQIMLNVSWELLNKYNLFLNCSVISELNKFMGVIKLERKQFETERERMLHFITEMDRYNREQRELRRGFIKTITLKTERPISDKNLKDKK